MVQGDLERWFLCQVLSWWSGAPSQNGFSILPQLLGPQTEDSGRELSSSTTGLRPGNRSGTNSLRKPSPAGQAPQSRHFPQGQRRGCGVPEPQPGQRSPSEPVSWPWARGSPRTVPGTPLSPKERNPPEGFGLGATLPSPRPRLPDAGSPAPLSCSPRSPPKGEPGGHSSSGARPGEAVCRLPPLIPSSQPSALVRALSA